MKINKFVLFMLCEEKRAQNNFNNYISLFHILKKQHFNKAAKISKKFACKRNPARRWFTLLAY